MLPAWKASWKKVGGARKSCSGFLAGMSEDTALQGHETVDFGEDQTDLVKS